MVTLLILSGGRWEGGHALCPSSWEMDECGHGHPHPSGDGLYPSSPEK